MSSYSAFSVFNRTIKDKKKEHSLNLYFKKIAPKLIKLIKEEIILKYPRIYENISTPLRNKSVGLMMSLCLQDAAMLRDNYKCTEMKESGLPGTSRYVTTKNRKNTPERMEIKKYNPILKRMTVHKEIK